MPLLPLIRPIKYLFCEGKDYLGECVRASFEYLSERKVEKIIIVTQNGEGILKAKEFLEQEPYKDIKVIGVGFPATFSEDISVELTKEAEQYMNERGIPFVRRPLPFWRIPTQDIKDEQELKQLKTVNRERSLIRNVLGIFSGGLRLCIQGVLMACDDVRIAEGEHVISLSADTSILASACKSENFPERFIIREIICKPYVLNITKGEENPFEKSTEPAEIPEKTE
jgi:hypothetical protein